MDDRDAIDAYRPELTAMFGEELTARVLDHAEFGAYVAEVGTWLDPDEAAFDAVEYLHRNPSATPVDAFAAIRDERRRVAGTVFARVGKPSKGVSMPTVTVETELLIHAPVGAVWHAIKDPEVYARWHPFVVRITGQHALGEVRTCKVMIDHRPGATRERCAEDDEEWRITWKIEDDSAGFHERVTNWYSGFDLEHREGGTLVTARTSFRPKGLLVWVLDPIMQHRFRRRQRTVLARLKQFIEIEELA